ncbi:hypothetical protein ACRALDRAFT_1036795, partial [Sodiomyces alcalophilus JCM 7366]
FKTELPYSLGSTNLLFTITTKIYTKGCSARAYALGFITDLYVYLLLDTPSPR